MYRRRHSWDGNGRNAWDGDERGNAEDGDEWRSAGDGAWVEWGNGNGVGDE